MTNKPEWRERLEVVNQPPYTEHNLEFTECYVADVRAALAEIDRLKAHAAEIVNYQEELVAMTVERDKLLEYLKPTRWGMST